jgi:hypothetical protein
MRNPAKVTKSKEQMHNLTMTAAECAEKEGNTFAKYGKPGNASVPSRSGYRLQQQCRQIVDKHHDSGAQSGILGRARSRLNCKYM